MEALISALGLVISTLMGLPARAAAHSDASKGRLGKVLFSIVSDLDAVITRGGSILDRLEELAVARDPSEFRKKARELRETVARQMRQLDDVGHQLSGYIGVEELEGTEYGWDAPSVKERGTDAQKVLSIYEPDLGASIRNIVGIKTTALWDYAAHFSRNVGAFDLGHMVVREITYIEPGIGFRLGRLDLEELKALEVKGKIKMRSVDLSMPEELYSYTSRARERLRELQLGRERLAHLIKQHFEPHHLI